MTLDQSLYPNVARVVYDRPWAILPSTLATIVDVLRFRAAGGMLSQDEIQERIALAAESQGPRQGRQRGSVAVIPLYGVLTPRATLMSSTSGGTSVEKVRGMFREALADPAVDAIVFDVDSPGGQVDGIPEFAAEIKAARGTKPILANANSMAASAAYWLMSQVDELSSTPSGSVGSIGVLAVHEDMSEADKMEGVKTTYVHAGKYKIEGNPHEPLGVEARAAIQTDVDAFYSMFVSAVAKGRGVPVDSVRADYGEGRMLLAADALERGMVDRVETLDDTVRRAARLAITGGQQKAALVTSVGYLAVHPGDLPPLDDVTDEEEGVTLPPDDTADPSDVLVSGQPISTRLALVSGELEAVATHLREHIAMRAKDGGRTISQATRDRVQRLLATRAILDEIEAMAAPAPARAARRADIELLEAAFHGGYTIPD